MSRTVGAFLAGAFVVLTSAHVAHASDPIAVYARVDRVVMEPNEQAPQAIQVWGVFAIAVPNNPNDYQRAARGYLYYTLPANADLARKEWADLKAVAGTGQIVAFGTRWELPRSPVRLRQADEKPGSPDAYSLNIGLRKINGRTDYGPVRMLIDFKP